MLNERRRSRPQNQKLPRRAPGVNQRAQYTKQVGFELDFIDDDQSVCQWLQKQLWLGQLGQIRWSLQVKHHGASSCSRQISGQLFGQRSLAHLTGTDQAYNGKGLQAFKQTWIK